MKQRFPQYQSITVQTYEQSSDWDEVTLLLALLLHATDLGNFSSLCLCFLIL